MFILIWVEEIIQPELNEHLREKIVTDLFNAWLKQQIQHLQINAQLEDKSVNTSLSKEIAKQA